MASPCCNGLAAGLNPAKIIKPSSPSFLLDSTLDDRKQFVTHLKLAVFQLTYARLCEIGRNMDNLPLFLRGTGDRRIPLTQHRLSNQIFLKRCISAAGAEPR